MITLFTTTKDFEGINRSNQLNAIRSWLSSYYKPQVIVFGKSKGIDELEGIESLTIMDQVQLSDSGAPFADEMFAIVSEVAKFEICCYVNADILLPTGFFENIISIHKQVINNYLIVGERMDVDVNEELIFNDTWEKDFLRKYKSFFKPHPPFGSDYFVFPKQQYKTGKMSRILIGRPGWDLWMIYNARKNKYKTIDLTYTSVVYHQNHDYSHIKEPPKPLFENAEVMLNLKDIPQGDKLLYILNACNYLYSNAQIKKSYSRGNVMDYVKIEKALGYYNFLTKIDVKRYQYLQRIRNSIFLKLLRSPKRKFNVGSAKFAYEKPWLFTDKDSLDITKANEWRTYLRFLKLNTIFAEHVWEHLSEEDTELANKNCFYFLKRKGRLRIAVPDGYHPDKTYIDNVKPGGHGLGADDHKILYNYKIMKKKLEKVGFVVHLLEYWDENGLFHSVDWTDEDGRIARSKRYDVRNQCDKLNYTSLIVDAVKP